MLGKEKTPEKCDKASCRSCAYASTCASANSQPEKDPDAKLKARLDHIRRKILIISGKGGVGKSTVAVNLAMSAMCSGQRVGLLDIDLHGPSVPTMLGLEGQKIQGTENGLLPVTVNGLSVLSVGFLLDSPDDPVIWRGPLKMSVIRQFIEDVEWGDLDLLVIDAPPGTGDEPLTVCQLIPDLSGAVVVTTPQKVSAVDVRKSVTFCKKLNIKILGVVENMSGFMCPKCKTVTPIFRKGGGKALAEEMGIPFLGSIPIDPSIVELSDAGKVFVSSGATSPAAAAFREILRKL